MVNSLVVNFKIIFGSSINMQILDRVVNNLPTSPVTNLESCITYLWVTCCTQSGACVHVMYNITCLSPQKYLVSHFQMFLAQINDFSTAKTFDPLLIKNGLHSWAETSARDPGFDSRHHQIFWVAVGLEWGPLSLVRITEELLERKSSSACLENRD
jgi:hypothetical protein